MKDSNQSRRQQVFQFKQFEVDQSGCAMKINTDGVLLGALAGKSRSEGEMQRILDIGTGTGVIALMLAQRFQFAHIEAIEIDRDAAERAEYNFNKSPFSGRMDVFGASLADFDPFAKPHREKNTELGIYDLIVSNPPYFLDSLKNPDKKKEVARHTDRAFFALLLNNADRWLKPKGELQLILPPQLSTYIEKTVFEKLSESSGDAGNNLFRLVPMQRIEIYSFEKDTQPIRILQTFRKSGSRDRFLPFNPPASAEKFVIYSERGVYSQVYRQLLADFFLSF